ncbi:reverse transcriptase domain-containing protein [Tanacetum coccineum]
MTTLLDVLTGLDTRNNLQSGSTFVTFDYERLIPIRYTNNFLATDNNGIVLDKPIHTDDDVKRTGNGYQRKRHKAKPKEQNRARDCKEREAKDVLLSCFELKSLTKAMDLLRNRRRSQQQVPPNLVEPPKDTMADQPTMSELLQAPTEGYEDAIVVPAITIDNFELKHGLLTLITSTLKFPNVPNTSVKLMLFPFSLEGAARIWLEKEPSRSILTWDDLVLKFINNFFPPSKMTNLRNEITNFQQRFDESFSEAWDRFKDLLRACPHHGFSKLHQLDMFYNALNTNDQDYLNSAVGGNFLDKRPRDCLCIIKSKSKVRQSRSKAIVSKVSTSTSASTISPDVAELKDMLKALLLDKQKSHMFLKPLQLTTTKEIPVTVLLMPIKFNLPVFL